MSRPFGPYRLIELLGKGGMGEVWLALGPPVDGVDACVVKLMRLDVHDKVLRTRFLDEARVVMLLRHRFIARALEAGVVGARAFLAFELVMGGSLAELIGRSLEREALLDPEIVVWIMGGVLGGLAHAHAARDPKTGRQLSLVHRDVSPHNIMVHADGTARLIDFGVATHELKVAQTGAGQMVGKVRYAAPEYIRGELYDHRSDLFGVAVTLYEALAGERFYPPLDELEAGLLAEAGTHRPAGLANLPRKLRAVVERGLFADPTERFADAVEMRTALAEAWPIKPDVGTRTAALVQTDLAARLRGIEAALERGRDEDLTDPTLPPPSVTLASTRTA